MLQFAPKATYSREEVRRLLALTERQLRGWERSDLIRPSETFAFTDLIVLRALIKLRDDRVSPRRIRAALCAVRERFTAISDPLRELKLVAHGRRIRVEVSGQQMDALSGQFLLDFDRRELRGIVSFPEKKKEELRIRRDAAESWFQRGLECEQTGAVKEAIKSYEAAVELDPGSAGAWLNLGTIFFNARQLGRAETYYKRSLEADAEYALAHFNIANLYDERGDHKKALLHYQHAVRLVPTYSDAHYNLALLYQGSGRVMDAVRHWKHYLKLDPGSSWGAIARRELEKLRKSTIVQGARPSPTGTANLAD
ncbi:MAG TPA: tetratricopeptide repeat protein [Bryobacteraceae bacterium]|nr:tetratricopeptide repeat protein [Bryobacteraceae bacterium]